jgi:hypothetical protein
MARPKKKWSYKTHFRFSEQDKHILDEIKLRMSDKHGVDMTTTDVIRSGMRRVATSLGIQY